MSAFRDTRSSLSDNPPDWVPVERRWLGLDRRSLGPALVVVVIGIILGGVLPLINQAISTDDAIVAGDVLDLGDGITIVGPAGWQLESGILVSDEGGTSGQVPRSAVVSDGGVTATIRTFATTDGPEAILDDFEAISGELKSRPGFTVSGGRAPVTATGGVSGVMESYSGAGTEGLIAVFTFAARDVAVAVEVDAPQGQLASAQPEVGQMLRSVRRDSEGSR